MKKSTIGAIVFVMLFWTMIYAVVKINHDNCIQSCMDSKAFDTQQKCNFYCSFGKH